MSSVSRALVLGFVLAACCAVPTEGPHVSSGLTETTAVVEGRPEASRVAKAVRVEGVTEVEFDPAHPPEGYTRCQGKECHTADGRIVSYAQVMAEIDAVRMVGGLDTTKLAEAPKDVASAPEDAERSASGLAWRVLHPGTGRVTPGPTSRVTVHYSGWTSGGKALDGSMARGRPSAFPLNRVIPGWQEALQLMVVGEKRRVWVPEALAYQGHASGPAGALVFDLELVAIVAE
jgi:hypothetical protein